MINTQDYNQPAIFSPIVKNLAITSTALGTISALAGGILFALNYELIVIAPLIPILAILPPILPIALCAIGASAIIISSIYLLVFKSHVNSQYQQALKYSEGTTDVPKDEAKAFELFYKAANSGHVMAGVHLARCYRCAIGCNQDKAKAFDLIRKIAATGNEYAQLALVDCYDRGLGCERDQKKAFELLKKLAHKNFLPAQFIMGEYYGNENPALITKHEPKLNNLDLIKKEAIKWYTLASNSKATGKEELSGCAMADYIENANVALNILKSDV